MPHRMTGCELSDVRKRMLVAPDREVRILAADAVDFGEQWLGKANDVEGLPRGKAELQHANPQAVAAVLEPPHEPEQFKRGKQPRHGGNGKPALSGELRETRSRLLRPESREDQECTVN